MQNDQENNFRMILAMEMQASSSPKDKILA